MSQDSFDASASPFVNCKNIKRLDGEQQKTCERLISEEECLSDLEQFAKNNIGPMFRKWIHTFYSNITNCVMNSGYPSDFFQLYRGVRRGCPSSGLLFVFAMDVLAPAIRQNENIRGLKIDETE